MTARDPYLALTCLFLWLSQCKWTYDGNARVSTALGWIAPLLCGFVALVCAYRVGRIDEAARAAGG